MLQISKDELDPLASPSLTKSPPRPMTSGRRASPLAPSVWLTVASSFLAAVSSIAFAVIFQRALNGFARQIGAFVSVGVWNIRVVSALLALFAVLFILYLLFIHLASLHFFTRCLNRFGSSCVLFFSSFGSQGHGKELDPMPPTETADKTDGGAAIDGKDKCPYKLWDEETVFEGRWLRTKEVKFRTRSGQEGVWQSSHRVTKPKSAEVDGVDIIAVLKKNGKKYFIFVKQYRIPMGGFCLEFPAGLVDAGETAEQTAQRELKEETGYTASRILHRSRGMQGLDPGLTDDSIQFVTVEVDGDAPENLQPKQRLEADEAIEVVLVECSKALEYIEKAQESLHVEAMVYSFVAGVSMASSVFA